MEAALGVSMLAYNLMSVFRHTVMRQKVHHTLATLHHKVLAMGGFWENPKVKPKIPPDGHFKFLHLWPVKFLQAGQVNYQSFCPPGAGPFCL